MEEWKEGEEMK
jgi:hypothetical protein